MIAEDVLWLAELVKLMDKKPETITIGQPMILYEKNTDQAKPLFIAK